MQLKINKKYSRIAALALVVVMLFSLFGLRTGKAKQITVVIQPGHAVGEDPGTTSSPLITEAELNERVSIALMK